ncbi:MAG: ABC transporter permease [Acidobacteria bacterium]|nr:ABC transporter permease [Acidobacteriota bacterium]
MQSGIVVFRKELLEGIRDRRAFIAVLISISIFPVLMMFIGRFSEGIRDEVREMDLPVQGAEHAPELSAWLAQRPGLNLTEAPEDPEAAVRDREVDLVLRIPENYGERFAEGRPAELKVIADSSRAATSAKAGRITNLLEAYGQEIAAMRLVSRGVSPLLVRPLAVDREEVFSSRRRAAFSALGFIPMFLLMNAFFGGMQIAADAIAGERERGSIEALLVNAVPARLLVLGKWAAAGTFAVFMTLLGIGTCVLVLRFMPGTLNVTPSVTDWALVAFAAIPLALFCSALQVVVSTYAKSYKEAQTYFGYVAFLPMIPFFAVTFNLVEQGAWTSFIPVLGQHLMILSVVGGEPVATWELALAGLIALGAAAALLRFASALFVRESVVFVR